jgi:hypothetical protein
MKLPEKINADWISALSDEKLVEVEATLHAKFVKEESAEKKRAGEKYEMMRGPESLMSAWMRWLLVNNETQDRRVVVQRRLNNRVTQVS